MLGPLRRLLGLDAPSRRPLPRDFPTVSRDDVAHLLRPSHGLPQVDWDMAQSWIRHHSAAADPSLMRRAVAATWLDELRDALTTDHRRWRHADVEGLAPLDASKALAIADAADRSYPVIHHAMHRIRGGDPIPPIAIVALGTLDEYYSFIAHFYPDEGHWATSGGLCIHQGDDAFPLLVIAAAGEQDLGAVVSHELTHHALRGRGLPSWAEEGLTQMMEERVTGRTHFSITTEIMTRHRAHWSEDRLDAFIAGDTFSSPDDEDQELSYHLAQIVVRGLLTQSPEAFFLFAQACAGTDDADAALQHLGDSPQAIAARFVHR